MQNFCFLCNRHGNKKQQIYEIFFLLHWTIKQIFTIFRPVCKFFRYLPGKLLMERRLNYFVFIKQFLPLSQQN